MDIEAMLRANAQHGLEHSQRSLAYAQKCRRSQDYWLWFFSSQVLLFSALTLIYTPFFIGTLLIVFGGAVATRWQARIWDQKVQNWQNSVKVWEEQVIKWEDSDGLS